MKTITVPRWFDRHLHLRQGEMLKTVLPSTLTQKATGAVIMGNLKPPNQTSTIERAMIYENEIVDALPEGSDFAPCMTLYLTDDIKPVEVVEGFYNHAWCAVKLYMADQDGKGGTTGSHHGVRNLLGRYEVFEAMAAHDIPLLGHFEAVESEVDEFDREQISLVRDLAPLLKQFPSLKVVVEHVTDRRMAEFVAGADHDIRATVTAHHLMIDRNAMFRGGMNPGYYCKPVPKRKIHQETIRALVTSGNRRFGAGTDSAPHDEEAKSLCYGCAAGIFTAPSAVELYTTVFDQDDQLEHLGAFLSQNFLDFYGMDVSKEMMTLEKRPHLIPHKIGPVQVFMGGETLPWTLSTLTLKK